MEKKEKAEIIVGFVIALICFALAGFVLIAGLNDRSESLMILKKGERTIGTVVRKESDVLRDMRNSDGEVEYVFLTPEGQQLTGVVENARLYRLVREGGPVDIAYDRAEPGKNFPVKAGLLDVGEIVFASAAPASFGFLLIVLTVYQVKKKRAEVGTNGGTFSDTHRGVANPL